MADKFGSNNVMYDIMNLFSTYYTVYTGIPCFINAVTVLDDLKS